MSARGRFLHAAVFATILTSSAVGSSPAEELAVVAHVHTPVGGGEYTPEELAAMLDDQGLDGAIFTDRDRLEIEWGLPFFRHFLRARYRRTSLATEGVDAYASAIHAASERFPKLVLLPGTETNPYYRIVIEPWPFRVRVVGLHEHLLAFGLPPSDLADVPSVANGFHSWFDRWTVAYAGAALVALASAGVWRIRRRPVRLREMQLRRRRAWLPVLVTLVPGLAIVDHLALRASVFHPYTGEDPGAAPFQSFIDWVAARGGLTFWAHPGVDETIRAGPVEVVTRPYLHHLAETDRYDGLTGFHPAMSGPGGLWDRLLAERCDGRRERAPWFLAQADFRSGSPRQLWYAVNHVTVAGRTGAALLDGLRAGRFYSTRSNLGRRWRLAAFRAEAKGATAGAGQALETDGPATILATLAPKDDSAPPLWIRVVGNGTTLLERWIGREATIRLEEPPTASGCRWFRIVAGRSTGTIHLLTNPIFLEPRREPGR